MKRGFERLIAWQEARKLAVAIFRLCRSTPLQTEWGIRDQMQRAAISISSNIAEGFERESLKDELRFLSIAKASASELRSQLLVAGDLGMLDEKDCARLNDHCHRVGSLIFNLMAHKRRLLDE